MSVAPARTYVGAEAGLQPLARARSIAWPNIATRIIAFCAISIGTHFALSLSGQVLLEQARREAIQSGARLKGAQQTASALRSEVDTLTDFKSVQNWAFTNGFVASEPSAEPSKGWFRVASRIP